MEEGTMLALLGFGTIIVFTVLVMWRKLSAIAGLVLVPLLFGLLGGFGEDLGKMMLSGIKTTAPTAVMLTFALMFFLVMTECGLFEPLVRLILRVVKEDPVKIAIGTALLIMVISLDGDGSTAVFIVLTSMWPIYRAIKMNPLIMAMLLGIITPTTNWLPWGGPAARMATSLRIDISEVVVPMLPALVLTHVGALGFAYLAGRIERKRLNKLKASGVESELLDLDIGTREAKKSHFIWFNLFLTIAFIAGMALEILPLPAWALVAFSVAVTVNWPNLKTQTEKLKPHGWTIVTVVSLILAAGAFTGIINETGMVSAMADSLVSVMPQSWGTAFTFIVAAIAGPLLFVLSNDGFYFGVVPILAEAGANFGVPPAMVSHAVLPGIYLHTMSPLNAPLYLVAAMLRTDFGSLWRFAFPWAIGITLWAILMATVTGAIGLV